MQTESEGRVRQGEDSASFLVRVWREPGGVEVGQAPVRCFVRNLRTGAETYIDGPENLPAELRRELDTTSGGESRGDRQDASG